MMEFRCLLRKALVPRPLLASPKNPYSISTYTIRAFSNTSGLRYPPPTNPTATRNRTSNASSGTTINELLELVKTKTGPARRNFESLLESNEFSRGQSLSSPPLGNRAIPRTGPSAGRSVQVRADLPSALSRLRMILTANNVKADQVRQRFHERPGLKKKRLKSARHRKRFKAGFKKLVSIAMEMKRKGL
jgi:small subunit ribosomal protein MRP21